MRDRTSGFTLIELLIVIAIIAILALIAVPNFLEAQTRAKYSRSLADMRSLMSAIASLNIDTGHLPIDNWDDDRDEGLNILRTTFNSVGDLPSRTRMHILAVLTSPVSYMTSLPADPFVEMKPSTLEGEMLINTYIYADQDPGIPSWIAAPDGRLYNFNVEMLWHYYAAEWGANGLDPGQYALIGYGPDKIFGTRINGVAGERGLPYSPTNGTVSAGDLILTSNGSMLTE